MSLNLTAVMPAIGIFFGLAFLITIPPFEGGDEFAHFLRAYQVSEGGFVAESLDRRVGGTLPRSLGVAVQRTLKDVPFHPDKKHHIREILAVLYLDLKPADRVFMDFPNSALTFPVPYIPQTVAIGAGRLLGLSPLFLLYFGRLLNLAAWSLLVWQAVRLAPFGKWLFIGLAFAPMSLFQASTLSPDAATNGLAFVWVALCLRHHVERGPLSYRQLLVLFTLAVAVALTKTPYVVLVLLWFLIPPARLGRRTRFLALSALLLAGTAVLALGWASIVHSFNLPYGAYHPGVRDGQALIAGADPDRQLARIVANPIGYASVLGKSFAHSVAFVHYSFIGQLGWDVFLPNWLVWTYTGLLLGLTLVDNAGNARFGWPPRLLMIIVAGATACVVGTLLYLVWTPVGRARIEGLHGRYLIPIGAPTLLALSPGRDLEISRPIGAITPMAIALFLSLTLVTLIRRYYLPGTP